MTSPILCVVGARPNFMKIAPVMTALGEAGIPTHLVHTGQHYDASMKASFFRELAIPEPDVDLEVGSDTHGVQTARIMISFEPVLDRLDPGAVLVVGDVNSTLAAALVAAKKEVPVIHVEAGLRSYDRSMPEEINRVLTDQISELLFTSERGARENLLQEGVSAEKIHFVGNVMIDSLFRHLEQAISPGETLARHGRKDLLDILESGRSYGVVTLHRPSNVDDPASLEALLACFARIGRRLPLVFPVHPRTSARLETSSSVPDRSGALVVLPPLGYLEMLGLLKNARCVMTDSGGVQEETTALGVPCLTLRTTTERPITVDEGTNIVTGPDPERIEREVEVILSTGGKKGRRPELWDGHAAPRIAEVIREWLTR